MNEFKPELLTYLKDTSLKHGWIIIFIIGIANVFFKPIINYLLIPLIIGIIYSNWLYTKDKYVTHLFEQEEKDTNNALLAVVILVEAFILLVGMHFLFKGFSTVTGVSEDLLNLKLIPVSFLLALAVVIGMIVILYKIKHSARNGKLILIYVLVDIFILFPYNFIFSYEQCVNDNIAHYYANAMPQLYDNFTVEVSKKRNEVDKKLAPLRIKNDKLKSDIDGLKEEQEAYEKKYLKGISELDENAQKKSTELYKNKKMRIESKISGKERALKIDVDDVRNDSVLKSLEEDLKTLSFTIKGILNKKIKKDNLYDTIVNSKTLFLKIYNSSLIGKDSVNTNLINKLGVVPESPTDGFFNLLKDLFSGILKDKYTKHSNTNNVNTHLTTAQLEWDALASQKRWFSFLFAVLIDVFPLIFTICYIHYSRNRRNKT